MQIKKKYIYRVYFRTRALLQPLTRNSFVRFQRNARVFSAICIPHSEYKKNSRISITALLTDCQYRLPQLQSVFPALRRYCYRLNEHRFIEIRLILAFLNVRARVRTLTGDSIEPRLTESARVRVPFQQGPDRRAIETKRSRFAGSMRDGREENFGNHLRARGISQHCRKRLVLGPRRIVTTVIHAMTRPSAIIHFRGLYYRIRSITRR